MRFMSMIRGQYPIVIDGRIHGHNSIIRLWLMTPDYRDTPYWLVERIFQYDLGHPDWYSINYAMTEFEDIEEYGTRPAEFRREILRWARRQLARVRRINEALAQAEAFRANPAPALAAERVAERLDELRRRREYPMGRFGEKHR